MGRRACLAAALLLTLATRAPASGDVAGFLAEVGEAQRGVAVFRARFEPEKRLEIVRDVLRSSGTILVSRERGIVWSVEEPERARMAVLPDGIFVDGRRLGEMPGAGGSLPLGRLSALFGGLSPALLEDFEVERLGDDRLHLRPRGGPLSEVVRELTLTLAGEHRLPSQITLDETAGGTTEIRLDHFDLDPAIPEGAFAP